MIMRKIALLVALVAVTGIGAWYGLSALSSKGVEHGLDQALHRLPPGWTVTYKSAKFGVVSDRAVLQGVEIHGAGATKLDARIDELDVAGLSVDLGANWAEAARDPAGMAPDKALPIADTIELKGVAIDLDGQKFTLGSARLTKLRLYPWALLHDGVPSYSEILTLVQHPSAEPKPEDILPLLRYIAAYSLGLGYDSYAITDGAARVRMPVQEIKLGEITYAVKQLSAHDVDRGRLGAAAVEGLAVTAEPDLDLKIDHVGLSSLDVRNLGTQILSGAKPDPSLLDGVGLGKLDYAGITAKTPSGPPVTLDGLTLANITFAQGLLASADFSVAGLKIAKAQVTDPDMLATFDQWGLDVPTLNFGGGYKWNAEKKTAALHEVTLKIAELGALTLSADLAGIDKPETIEQTATLNHAVLRYTDASLVGRALKIFSAAGADPAESAKQLAHIVQAQGALLGNSPAVAAATRALGVFLIDPHNLTIEAAPPEPLAFATLDADKDLPPAEIFAKLGVTVTANQ
jgi:hypothetical protein